MCKFELVYAVTVKVKLLADWELTEKEGIKHCLIVFSQQFIQVKLDSLNCALLWKELPKYLLFSYFQNIYVFLAFYGDFQCLFGHVRVKEGEANEEVDSMSQLVHLLCIDARAFKR